MDSNNQHPIDYLDTIATVPKGGKKAVSDKLFFGIIAGGILIALSVGALALLNSGTNTRDDLERLSVRLNNLQSLTDISQKSLTGNSLRSINSTLSLTLANTNRDITEVLATNNIDLKKTNPRIVEDESTDEVMGRLEDARLNAILDRTYAREMSYQLETLIALLSQIEAKTKSTSTKDFLSATRESIQPLQQQFSEFSGATS